MQIIQDLQMFVLVMGVVCTMEFVISYTHDLGIPSLGVCLFILFLSNRLAIKHGSQNINFSFS